MIASAPYTVLPLRYYHLRNDLQLVAYPDSGMLAPGQTARDLGPMLQSRDRVWLFLSRTFHSDPEGEIVKYVGSAFGTRQEFTAAGVQILLYTRESQRSAAAPK